MNTYPSYKDSGVEWVGEIPSVWVKTKFKWDIFFQEGPGLRTFQFTESGIRVICVSNITEKGIDFSTTHTRHISEDEYSEKYRHFTVDDRDILLSSSGSIGKVSRYYFDGQPVILNTSTIRLHSKNRNKVYDDFIPYYLSSEYVQLQLRFLMTGGVVNNFGPSHLDQLFMYLPTISEQTHIISFLDTKTQKIDKLIEKTEQKIKLLKEKRTSLINHCVTKGLNPNVEMKDSGVEWIGEIPSHWDKTKVKYVTEIFGRIGYRGYTTDDIVDEGEGVVTISPSNIKNDIFNLDSVTYLSYEKYYESPEIMVFTDDIIIVKTGSTIGKTSIIPDDVPEMTINPQLVVLKNIQVFSKFLYYQTTCRFIKESFDIEQTGSTTPTISQEKINEFPIIEPPTEEQTQIVEYLDEQTQKIDSTIEKETQRTELLKEYRQSLISEVVTGKIDVRDWKE